MLPWLTDHNTVVSFYSAAQYIRCNIFSDHICVFLKSKTLLHDTDPAFLVWAQDFYECCCESSTCRESRYCREMLFLIKRLQTWTQNSVYKPTHVCTDSWEAASSFHLKPTGIMCKHLRAGEMMLFCFYCIIREHKVKRWH